MHKLLYYCQAHHLVRFGIPLFEDTISAWDMGPVVGQLWWQEKQGSVELSAGPVIGLDEGELNTIGYVLSRYGKLSGLDLERMTHSEPPWIDADRVRKDLRARSSKITADALLDFFRSEVQSEESADPELDPSEVAGWLKGAIDRSTRMVHVDTAESLLARLR